MRRVTAEKHHVPRNGSEQLPDLCSSLRLSARNAILAVLTILALALPALADSDRHDNPEYLISHWSAGEGVPENSALTVAQTPDGYLFVGSTGGLLRYNAFEFERVSRTAGLKELDTITKYLTLDRSGRFWVATTSGLAVLEKSKWRVMHGPVLDVRTIAEAPKGGVFVGTADGKVYRIENDIPVELTNSPPLTPGGVFIYSDSKESFLWLANKTFVGRWTGSAWKPVGEQPSVKSGLLAYAGPGGGLWVYYPGRLCHYQKNGKLRTWDAPSIDQPREMFEDSSGFIWVASATQGLIRWRPGGEVWPINATNGLSYNAARSIFQDAEDNLWIGTTTAGLFRLTPRQFKVAGHRSVLADQIVKSIAEEVPGRILIGTHGEGVARVEEGKVTWARSAGSSFQPFAWSLLRDRAGRLWTGTYGGGLFVQENGAETRFPLPGTLGNSIGSLYEDSKGRIWVGTSLGLGLIKNQTSSIWPVHSSFTNVNVRLIAEDPGQNVLWIGTYGHGLWRVDLSRPGQGTQIEGLPRKRITSLSRDEHGCLWVGVFGEGLLCIRDGKIQQISRRQGLPANTVGSILWDSHQWCWLGTDQGIMRVSSDALHRIIEGKDQTTHFSVFNSSDGMESPECSEGFQSTGFRDSSGKLWFGTLHGAIYLDPARLRLNKRPPLVQIESFSYTDRSGVRHTFAPPDQAKFQLPAGSTDLEFRYSALSYTAPEKVQFAYYLEGVAGPGHYINTGNRRVASVQSIPPGNFTLRVKAANNDGVWNSQDASLAFSVSPFFWQTFWFRGLSVVVLMGSIGLGGWRIARTRYRNQIERLEQQRALAHERARLAAVMEATTDLVAFADRHGNLLHMNAAGRHMLGYDASGTVALNLCELFTPWAAQELREKWIPHAEQHGTWQGESTLLTYGGKEIPVSQVVITHRDESGRIGFLSTIVRDISEHKRAAKERELLHERLAQAQKMESIGRLAGGVAHDFNNMMQVILGNVELALEQVRPGDPLHTDLLEISKSAHRSAALTRQLLGFARKQTYCPRMMSLNEAMQGMMPMLKGIVGETISLDWQPGSDLWSVEIDPAQLDQILTTLVTNARDALDSNGSITIQTGNFVVTQANLKSCPGCSPGDYVNLTVTDTGHGMKPEVLQHVFEPFFTTKALGEGTGLALATVFGIVKQNHGAITVESRPEHGSTFRIYLPRANSGQTERVQDLKSMLDAKGTVLLVDDEKEIVEFGSRVLRDQGFTVLTANLPESALDTAISHEGPIQLLITDVMMPGMNGKELKQRLGSLHPRLKCIYMSGYASDVVETNGGLGPNEDFIRKPFTVHELSDKVQSVLS